MGTQEISVIQGDILATEPTFNAVLSDKSVVFQREAEFAIQVLSGSEYALKVALGNRQSVVNAVTNLAAIGLSLNPARKLAYLVPRDGKICLDVSYMGLVELAVASGSVRWAKAELVRAADQFELAGFGHPPSHKFNPFAKDRGEIVGVYCVAKTADGDYLTDTMSIDEVRDIRDRSSAWKAWIAKQKKCPWVTDPGEMAKKTVLKRASKMWPKTERLDQAIHYLNNEGGEGLADLAEAPKTVDGQTSRGSALPPLPDGYFTERRLASWAATIASGANTNQGLIDTLSTRFTLSEQDKEFLRTFDAYQGESA